MNEDFTEEFENDLPEGVEFAEPAEPNPPLTPKAKVEPPRVPADTNPRPRGRPRQIPPPATAETITERFTPFITPRRVGVLDNETKEPLMEDKDTNTLLLGLITKLLNDVDDIKKNL